MPLFSLFRAHDYFRSLIFAFVFIHSLIVNSEHSSLHRSLSSPIIIKFNQTKRGMSTGRAAAATVSNNIIENLPLIAREGQNDNGSDNATRRGHHQGGLNINPTQCYPLRPVATIPPVSSSPSPFPRMTADGDEHRSQQQDQQKFPQHRPATTASSTFYAQQQVQPTQNIQIGMQNSPSPPQQNSHEFHDNETFDGSEDTPAQMGGPTVTCRVCEADIAIEGKTNQHVVRCLQCNEVTPIRAAPPGRKYVRCPCNCLLVCKATSTRIACPRQNCRRVITLVNGPPNSGIPGTAIRAPVGTCRVQCAYCQEIFMFNTLTNQLAICPHCRKSSSVGARYTRSRSLLYFVFLLISSLFLIGVIVAIAHGNDSFFMYAFMSILLVACAFLTYRFIFFIRIRVSQVLGPL